MSQRTASVPASLIMITAVFLGLVGGVVGFIYSYPLLQAASNPSSNLTRSLYNEAISQGLNYTIQQVQGLMRQTAYTLMALSVFLAVLGVVAWLFAYRPAIAGQYARAAQGALFTGILYILTSLAGSLYTGLFAIIGGVLLLIAWYRLRSFSRALSQPTQPPPM
ncbi:MAG: hypothetical protein ACP5HK_01850 [Acidilobus sp.]